jgi:hypothetical protein
MDGWVDGWMDFKNRGLRALMFFNLRKDKLLYSRERGDQARAKEGMRGCGAHGQWTLEDGPFCNGDWG